MKTLCFLTASALLWVAPHASAADGAALYAKKCASCHGNDGKGETKMGKKLKIKDLTAEAPKLSDAQIIKSVKEGVTEGGKMRMKAIKGMSDADIQAVVQYVRTLK